MDSCALKYIPDRLHAGDKIVSHEFTIGEFLFRRCTAEQLDNPFKNISIADISLNRAGQNNSISNADDVLYNIRVEDEIERYEGLEVCELEVISLDANNRYIKHFEQGEDAAKSTAILELLHDADPCMYPHCIFKVTLDDQHVTMDNYKQTLNKKQKIKTAIKDELANMIFTKEIDQEGNV